MIAGITEKEQKIIERILDKYRKDYAFFYYGSRVKGTYEKTSDLDILVKGKAEMPSAVLQGIKEEFDNSDLPYIVNFSDYYKLDGSFYKRIKPDLIPYNWQEVKLGDVLSFRYGKMPNKNKILSKGKYPIFTGYRYAGFYDEYNIEKNQLIIVARGVGGTGDVKLSKEQCFLTNLSIASSLKTRQVDVKYLFYYFTLHSLRYLDSGSAQSQITINDLEKIIIYLPPLDIQKKIAGVLGALDDKIELNNKINQNLEAQAQALFKSWFIDFEPFGGKMPNDWKIGKLGDIADITSGKRPLFKSNIKTSNTLIPIVGASGVMGYTKEYLYNNKILVTGRVGTHGIIQRFNKTCWPSDNTLIISSNFYEYVYNYLKIIDFSSMNRGSTQPLITQSDLKKCDIIIPSRLFLDKFEKNVSILFDLKDKNTQEIENLAELRDTLLPKLMNGEIDVDNVKID